MMDFETGLTQARLKELLHYDPQTGLFTWRVNRGAAYKGLVVAHMCGGYINVRLDGFQYYTHRLAWLYMTGTLPPVQIDHRDTVRSNNRWSNLRKATNRQNSTNASLSKNNTSGFKGVYWHKQRKKWAAGISVHKRHIHLGCFDDPALAGAAYEAAALKYFGEFARAA